MAVLAPQLLAGQSWGFWLLANGVALACAVALVAFLVPHRDAGALRGDLALSLAVAWLVLNAFYLWMRRRTSGLRRDVRSPRKLITQGQCQGVRASGNALIYTVDGQALRAYPALPLEQGFVAGMFRIESAATIHPATVVLERTPGGERLLSARYPTLDAAARLHIDTTLDAADVRRLRRRANWTAALLALGIGAVGMSLALAGGHTPWIWLLPMAALAALTRYRMRPQQWLGWAQASGVVTETIHASWRVHRVRRAGHWVRVAGRLFPVARPLPLGTRVRLRARLRRDGWPGETTEVEPLAPSDG